MDKLELLEQIKAEVENSRTSVQAKRDIFRTRLRQYVEPNKAEDKVDSNIIYSTLNTAVAINYNDKLVASFEPRRFGDEEYAENITELAKFDYEEMGLGPINFQKEWDRHFYGVGIRVKTGWDDIRKVPTFTVKDPLSWLPDVRGNHVDPFRFHYFEEEMLESEMTPEYGFIKDSYENAENGMLADIQDTKNFKNDAQGLQTAEEDFENHTVAVINGYTKYDGVWYAVTVDSECKKLLRAVEIEAVTKEEKRNPELIECPVIVSYYSPYRGDPYGVSLVDLIEDKQKAHKILSNLRLISAKFATFGQQFLYDPKAITNRNDLTKPSINPKWIAYNSSSGTPISSAIYPVPRESIMQDSFSVSQELVRQIQTDTGIDARALGVQGDENITLGEAQQIQANANVRFGLNVAVNFWSEKKFWKQWLRCYHEYFSSADKKFIRIANGFGSTLVEFRKDDFMALQDPDIVIDSEANANARRGKIQVAFSAKLPILLGDPSIPKIAKTMALRYSMKLDGVPREMVNVLVPPSYEELDAAEKVALLSHDDMLGAEVGSLQEDHMTYLVMFERAQDTKAKYEAIRRRKEAMVLSGQTQLTNPQMGAVS